MSVLLLLAGCSSQTADSRALWLRQSLINENAYWLARSPSGLIGKYEAMAVDEYDFMRGSAGTWYADVARRSSTRWATDLMESGEPILLVGDGHPENLSTTIPGVSPPPGDQLPAPEISLELIDLDASTYGPWLLDLRRSAIALRVQAGLLPECRTACTEAALTELVEEYIDGALGEPPPVQGSIIENLIAEAIAEGQARQKYVENTADTIFSDLQIRKDLELEPTGAGVLALTDEEWAQVTRLMAAYDAPEGFRMLDAARRFGTGISSRPAVRYLILWDLGDDTTDADNGLLSVREMTDPPAIPGLFAEAGDRHYTNAERIEEASALLWSTPDADAAAVGLQDGELSFKILTWSSWFQSEDHLKVRDDWDAGAIDAGDFGSLGGVLGHTLGSSHRRGETAAGGSTIPVLEDALIGNEDRLLEEILTSSAEDYDQLRRDYVRFLALLEEHGPLLGADQIATDLP